MSECVVCQIAKGAVAAHIVYEDESLLCFLDRRPINPGHVLICPRDHHADITDLPDAVLTELFLVARRMAGELKTDFDCDGVSLMQNNGRFNDLGHFHLHVFPRHRGDGFGWVTAKGGDVACGQ